MMMTGSILLIDDDSDDRTFFCEALQEVGPEIYCHTATDGRNAMAMFNNNQPESPDLIFLDINMPGLNGWQCLSLLKEHDVYKHIPVIMYSTSSRTEDIDKARELGAFGFLVKPNEFNELKRCLELITNHLRSDSLSSLEARSPLFVLHKRHSPAS